MLNLLFHNWLKYCVLLFFLTFVQEDVAIIAASFSKIEYGLPLGLAFISVYFGIVTGDLLIYGLGRVAQKNAWLQSKIIGPRVDQMRIWLESNFVKVAAICRITPGLLFPTFVAFGWFRLPVKRFLIISFVTAGIYTPLAMIATILLGKIVISHLGYWAWGVLIALAFIYPLVKWARFFGKKTNDNGKKKLNIPFLDSSRQNGVKKRFHKGMPSLAGIKRVIAQAERIPDWIFYIPVGLRWIGLSIRYKSLTLPALTNPLIETGGFWGESKSKIMESISNGNEVWLAKFITFTRTHSDFNLDFTEALQLIEKSEIDFPLVVKPDIGWQGFGVRLLKNESELKEYLSNYPLNETVILQEFIDYDGEAGVFYARMPNEPEGKVISLTLRYFPFVTGDGKSTLRQLIQNNPRTGFKSKYYLGNHPRHRGLSLEKLNSIPADGELVRLAFIGSIRIGGIYRDARHRITPALSKQFDAISKSIPEFYYGRFDIRFRSTELLMEGKDFFIFEINGSGSEPIHAWDPEIPFFKVYKELFKTQKLMFQIAACNLKRGFQPVSLADFMKAQSNQSRLLKSYPRSE